MEELFHLALGTGAVFTIIGLVGLGIKRYFDRRLALLGKDVSIEYDEEYQALRKKKSKGKTKDKEE